MRETLYLWELWECVTGFDWEMPKVSGKKEQAKTLYCQGLTLAEVARRVGVTYRTVSGWKSAAMKDGDDWKKLRDELKGKTPPARPNLVTFERPRGDKAKPAASTLSLEGLDRSQLVDKIIGSTARLIDSGDIPPGLGSALSGLATFIKLEKDLKPATAAELAQQAMVLGIKPGEFMQQLREAWERAG